jgi:hypothetical protein
MVLDSQSEKNPTVFGSQKYRRARKYAARLIICLVTAASVYGCAVNRESASLTPGAELTQVKKFYVAKFAPDERGINAIIMDDLIERGYQATTGPNGGAPDDVDAVVTYRDKWMWDITMYMLELDITLRNPKTKYPIAVGNSYHTSLTRKSPEEMVKEILTNIFNKSTPGKA